MTFVQIITQNPSNSKLTKALSLLTKSLAENAPFHTIEGLNYELDSSTLDPDDSSKMLVTFYDIDIMLRLDTNLTSLAGTEFRLVSSTPMCRLTIF